MSADRVLAAVTTIIGRTSRGNNDLRCMNLASRSI
jgi:hypothetical protein